MPVALLCLRDVSSQRDGQTDACQTKGDQKSSFELAAQKLKISLLNEF